MPVCGESCCSFNQGDREEREEGARVLPEGEGGDWGEVPSTYVSARTWYNHQDRPIQHTGGTDLDAMSGSEGIGILTVIEKQS